MDLENGMLVQHNSLGLGRVVALEPKAVHVFFASSPARFATKLRLPMAAPLLKPAAGASGWLSGLSDFALDGKTGRYGLPATWLPHADAVARFLEAFPKGFAEFKHADGGPDRRERLYRWRRAHDLYRTTLGDGQGERLLAAGDVAGLVERTLQVLRHVRPLLADAEKASLQASLGNLEAAPGYFAALFAFLATPAPEQERFEALAAAVAAMAPEAPPESGWPVVTLLPFLARPDLHMLLRPRFASDVSHRLGLELGYQPRPNWSTYGALLRSTGDLLAKLRPLGAADHIDVDSFMHVVTSKQPRAKAPAPLAT
jgi:hypothetical protein